MFYTAYIGNKRSEIKYYIEEIEKLIEEGKINKIIEPFCGSSATSFYLWKKYPNLEYHLNDLDLFLYEFLNDVKINGIKKTFDYINSLCIDLTKEKYKEICNNQKPKNYLDWVFLNKVHGQRLYLYPTNRKYGNYNPDKYKDLDKFFKSEKVFLYNKLHSEIFEKFKNDKEAFIFLDPPYFNSCNNYYNDYIRDHKDENKNLIDNTNIYEDIGNLLDDGKAFIILVVNDIGLMRYAYKKYYKKSYNKKYSLTQSKTKHAIFSNL